MSPSPSSFQGPSKNSRLYAAPLSLSRQRPSHHLQRVSQAYSWIPGCSRIIRWCWIQFVFIRLRRRNNSAADQVILLHLLTITISRSRIILITVTRCPISFVFRKGRPSSLFRSAAGGISTPPSHHLPIWP